MAWRIAPWEISELPNVDKDHKILRSVRDRWGEGVDRPFTRWMDRVTAEYWFAQCLENGLETHHFFLVRKRDITNVPARVADGWGRVPLWAPPDVLEVGFGRRRKSCRVGDLIRPNSAKAPWIRVEAFERYRGKSKLGKGPWKIGLRLADGRLLPPSSVVRVLSVSDDPLAPNPRPGTELLDLDGS